uniref:Uncharacterized protein n=1 Tax=viral metagenome TaxID=1070528 RepID=A0A6H2A3P7_9ZZZZ
MKRLTKENASGISTIECIEHPEWGVKRFNYNSQILFGGESCSTYGEGCNSMLLFESDFFRWRIVSFSATPPTLKF